MLAEHITLNSVQVLCSPLIKYINWYLGFMLGTRYLHSKGNESTHAILTTTLTCLDKSLELLCRKSEKAAYTTRKERKKKNASLHSYAKALLLCDRWVLGILRYAKIQNIKQIL